MSLLKDARGPFLIVTTSNSLSMWEAGFSRWGSHANLVVYKGCRNARSIIRSFEFYNENGDIMFQVLVSCIAGVFEVVLSFFILCQQMIGSITGKYLKLLSFE